MNEHWLLAAEADHIQDYVFRGSRLRSATGASQRLTAFCHELKDRADETPGMQALVSDAGAFRLVVEGSAGHALDIGSKLAADFHRFVGGSITVAEPVPYVVELPGFREKCHQRVLENLRAAKRAGRDPLTVAAQTPFAALCASCGVDLAIRYGPLRSSDDEGRGANYYCEACSLKADSTGKGFLESFLQSAGVAEEEANVHALGILPHMAEQVAALDPRRDVAYLLADVNGMGVAFEACESPEKLTGLSKSLSTAMKASLSATLRDLSQRSRECHSRHPNRRIQPPEFPMLPLILGGDDVFALVPAPFALDIALEFCRAFEANDHMVAERLTVTVAVVICKANFPFRLAHQYGEELLGTAKREAKKNGKSVIHADYLSGIRGGRLPDRNAFRATSSPWYPDDLAILLDQRHALRNLPGTRRSALRALWDDLPDEANPDEESSRRVQALLKRVESVDGREGEPSPLADAMKALGDPSGHGPLHWKHINTIDGGFSGHGLPDLLRFWRVAFKADRPLEDYETAAADTASAETHAP